MTQLRIASINIERSKHLHRVETFLKTIKPDVLCLQELCAKDIPFIEDLIGNKLHYAPMCLHPAEVELDTIGIGLISWTNLEDVSTTYYHGTGQNIREIEFIEDRGHRMADNNSVDNAIIAGTCQGFRIATTHLNVTRKGEASAFQLASAAKLIKVAEAEAQTYGGILLCGDFNAPRGNATFSLLAEHFIDGVPAHYTTSIDGSLHRAGHIELMVDGLFHTPSYQLQNAKLHTGVSDHCALTTTLLKA
ncbi:MAG: hypothetical protein DI585_00635 [Pseudomonas fluorescens]|nr:MAG: hypothetical protein DI585_00635 [Pseudomonas fluorescens]